MWNRTASPPSEGTQTTPAPPATSTTGARAAEERRTVAWVGKSVIFRGDLISSEDMTIDGRIEGTIEVRDHHLTIGPNATIEADVVAKMVTIFGKVSGSVIGHDKIDIRLGASVEANVTCEGLAIQDGAHFCGKVAMESPRGGRSGQAAGSQAATSQAAASTT